MRTRTCRSSRRLRPPLVLCVVLVLLLGASCSRNQGDRVAVIGDSLVTFDEPSLQKEFGDDFELVVSGNFGSKVMGAVPPAQVVSTTDADQVIINLGTNDVRSGAPIEESMAGLGAIVDLFPDARCIFLVNINEHMVDGVTGAPTTDGAVKFNEALDTFVERDDRLGIIDWNGQVDKTLAGDPPVSTLTTDSVHLTPEGNDVINGLYGKAVRGC